MIKQAWETKGDVELAVDIDMPKLFALVMYNDDYTTQEFVVEILMSVLAHPFHKAIELMLKIHFEGLAKVAVYPLEIAQMKQLRINNLAKMAGFPLLTTIEPE